MCISHVQAFQLVRDAPILTLLGKRSLRLRMLGVDGRRRLRGILWLATDKFGSSRVQTEFRKPKTSALGTVTFRRSRRVNFSFKIIIFPATRRRADGLPTPAPIGPVSKSAT